MTHSVVNLVNIYICKDSLITDTQIPLHKLCCEPETIIMAIFFPFSVAFTEHGHALVSLTGAVSVPWQRCSDSQSEMSHLHPGLSAALITLSRLWCPELLRLWSCKRRPFCLFSWHICSVLKSHPDSFYISLNSDKVFSNLHKESDIQHLCLFGSSSLLWRVCVG